MMVVDAKLMVVDAHSTISKNAKMVVVDALNKSENEFTLSL